MVPFAKQALSKHVCACMCVGVLDMISRFCVLIMECLKVLPWLLSRSCGFQCCSGWMSGTSAIYQRWFHRWGAPVFTTNYTQGGLHHTFIYTCDTYRCILRVYIIYMLTLLMWLLYQQLMLCMYMNTLFVQCFGLNRRVIFLNWVSCLIFLMETSFVS